MNTPIDENSPDPIRQQQILALGAALNALVSQSRTLTAQAAAAFHADLQPAAFHIAVWLNTAGRATPSALAEAVGMDRSAASRLIRALVALDLVATSTDPSDLRSVFLTLTNHGSKRLDAALQIKSTVFQKRLASWEESDLLQCASWMHKLIDTSVRAPDK